MPRNIKDLATTVVALLVTQIVLVGAESIALLNRISLLNRFGGSSLRVATTDADSAVTATSGLASLAFLATVVVWCIWQHHAQENATRMAGGPLKFTPGWAVGWWFIPIANLWKPFQAMRELWKASHGGGTWATLATWPVLGWWWALWLVGNVHVWKGSSGAGVSFGTAPVGEPLTASDLISRDSWQVLSIVVTVGAAILAIKIVRAITALQHGGTGWPPVGPGVPTSELPPPPPPPPV